MEDIGIICLLLGIIGLVIQSAIKSATKGPRNPPRAYVAPAKPILVARLIDGPGHFIIFGVDRATKMDTTWHCDAASEANARVKAELEGIIVTSIKREPK